MTQQTQEPSVWDTVTPSLEQIEAVAKLNDDMRRRPTGPGKRLIVTPGVQDLGPIVLALALRQVAQFDAFTPDNDPSGFRDFGAVTVTGIGGTKLFFKIDCYDPDMLHGSVDPSDPAKTVRVMTLMLPSEY